MARDSGWWRTTSQHVLTDDVAAPVEKVRDFYCDTRNISQVHPLVMSVDVIAHVQTGDSHTTTYRVKDRIPLGPLTLAVAYTASVDVPYDGDVLTEAKQFPGVRLHGRVSFDDIGAGLTRITERLTIEAPRPLAAMTVREAVKAHITMLAGIRHVFE